ncbi:MAG: DUF3857 domain-containing protein [Saprospiraceae bacterium]
MKYFFQLLLIVLPLIASATNKPQYAVSNILPELLENAEVVIREDFTTFNVLTPATAELKARMVITRLRDDASYDDLTIGYDMHTKVNRISAAIYDKNGALVRKIGKKEIQDYSAVDGFSIYTDSRLKYIDLSYGEYPYTIEYEYEKSYKGIQSYPGWYLQGFDTSVEKSGYVLTLANSLDVKYEVFNLSVEPEIQSAGGKKVYRWSAENLPVIEAESYSPSAMNILPKVLFAPEKFTIDGYTGSMTDWESFGKFMYELNDGRGELSAAMKAEIKKLTAEATTDTEKIEVLYRYIQDNMRYVSVQLGIGGWQTFDAAYVEKNKFGDCKALTYFMRTMLEEIGITAYPALVYAGRDKERAATEDFTFPLFNHVILNVPSADYWLECTSADSPPNYLGTFTDDRPVLLVTENGGVFSQTPTIPIEDNLQKNVATITLDEKGTATVTNQSILTGTQQEYYRGLEKNQSREDIKKYFSRIVDLPSFTLKDYELSSSMDAPQAEFSYEVEIPRYGSKAGKRLFLPLNVINPMSGIPDKVKERKFPVQIKRGYVEQDEFQYILPDGTTVESMPEKTATITSDFGTYEMEISQEKNVITYRRTLKINPITAPAERYTDWRNFCKEVAKLDKMKVVLIQEKT